jgi:hypothetical protein
MPLGAPWHVPLAHGLLRLPRPCSHIRCDPVSPSSAAATNAAEVLDAALTRPGRFDSKVTVSLPDKKGRQAILELYLKKIVAAPGVCWVFPPVDVGGGWGGGGLGRGVPGDNSVTTAQWAQAAPAHKA